MNKPIIGISGSIMQDEGGMFPGYKRAYVNHDYILSVVKNGGIPMVIPVVEDEQLVKQQVDCIDALILSGGQDVDPSLYGEEPKQKLGEIFPLRDQFDYQLIKYAKERKIPILGICRGHQILNVYHGGSLYQDLSYNPQCFVKHWQAHTPTLVTHSVRTEEGSTIASLFGSCEFKVNSFHHQLIKDVAPSLEATAYAKDNVVEAIEDKNYPFLLGVQWHPEMLHASEESMNAIFKALIDATTK